MNIGLIDVDSHNWPNLCLMKLSAWHRALGDSAEWWRSEGRHDLVYKSRVFTDLYSRDTAAVTNAGQVVAGGAGYGSTHEQDLYRVETLRGMGYDPFVMVYDRPTAPRITRQLQRWMNNKRIFHTVERFSDYIPGRIKKEE